MEHTWLKKKKIKRKIDRVKGVIAQQYGFKLRKHSEQPKMHQSKLLLKPVSKKSLLHLNSVL